MSWEDVTPINARTALGMVNYSYSPKLGARVTLPASVGAALKWTAGQAVKLQVGAGEHAGQLRLVADGSGPLNVRTCKTTALQVHIGKLDVLPAREVKRCSVRHEVEASALTITLPSHAQAIAHHMATLPVSVAYHEFPSAHEIRPSELAATVAWLESLSKTPMAF